VCIVSCSCMSCTMFLFLLFSFLSDSAFLRINVFIIAANCYVQVFRVEMRHGWLELSKWRSYIHELEEMLVSSDDPAFNSLIVRDKELTQRWTSLTHLLDHTEVML